MEPATAEGAAGAPPRPAFLAARAAVTGEALLAIPGDLTVTSVDVGKDAGLAAVAEGRSELVGLALWLMQEREKVRGLWLAVCCQWSAVVGYQIYESIHWDHNASRRPAHLHTCNPCPPLGRRARPPSGRPSWPRCRVPH